MPHPYRDPGQFCGTWSAARSSERFNGARSLSLRPPRDNLRRNTLCQSHMVYAYEHSTRHSTVHSLTALSIGARTWRLLDKTSQKPAVNVSFPKQGRNIPADVSCQSKEEHKPQGSNHRRSSLMERHCPVPRRLLTCVDHPYSRVDFSKSAFLRSSERSDPG